MLKRFHLPKTLTQKWYFFPIVGIILMILINGLIFGVLAFNKSRQSRPNDSDLESEASPTPEPETTATPEATVKPTNTPSTSAKPTPTVTPKPTIKPTPSPTPSPTATPVEKEDVRILNPTNERNYESTSIEIEMQPIVNGEIEKLEFIVNGSVKESFTSAPYKKTFDLSAGSYELYGKVTLKSGKTVTSGTVKFGTGGVSWDEPDPTATPTPEPTATP